MYTIGLNLSHNSSAAVIDEQGNITAVLSERISRIKHHFEEGKDSKALHYLLSYLKINPDQIQMSANFGAFLPAQSVSDHKGYFLPWKYGNITIPVRLFSHHLSHAASVYFTSELDDCLIMVSDARGSSRDRTGAPVKEADFLKGETGQTETISFFHGKNGKITVLKEFFFPLSLGEFYSLLTCWLGFNTHTDQNSQMDFNEGKTMGLSPYGASFFRGESFIFLEKDGFSFNPEYLIAEKNRIYLSDTFIARFGQYRKAEEPVCENHMLVSFIAQNDLEKTIHYLIETMAYRYPAKNLLLSGGTFHNSVLNGKIRQSTGFEKVAVFPAADDSGLAVGNALLLKNGY